VPHAECSPAPPRPDGAALPDGWQQLPGRWHLPVHDAPLEPGAVVRQVHGRHRHQVPRVRQVCRRRRGGGGGGGAGGLAAAGGARTRPHARCWHPEKSPSPCRRCRGVQHAQESSGSCTGRACGARGARTCDQADIEQAAVVTVGGIVVQAGAGGGGQLHPPGGRAGLHRGVQAWLPHVLRAGQGVDVQRGLRWGGGRPAASRGAPACPCDTQHERGRIACPVITAPGQRLGARRLHDGAARCSAAATSRRACSCEPADEADGGMGTARTPDRSGAVVMGTSSPGHAGEGICGRAQRRAFAASEAGRRQLRSHRTGQLNTDGPCVRGWVHPGGPGCPAGVVISARAASGPAANGRRTASGRGRDVYSRRCLARGQGSLTRAVTTV
jgi:hypothetical protein